MYNTLYKCIILFNSNVLDILNSSIFKKSVKKYFYILCNSNNSY